MNLFRDHEIEYIKGKGTAKVWGYKVNGRETSTNAGRILKQPFIVEYDERAVKRTRSKQVILDV